MISFPKYLQEAKGCMWEGWWVGADVLCVCVCVCVCVCMRTCACVCVYIKYEKVFSLKTVQSKIRGWPMALLYLSYINVSLE